ncbi:GTPase [Aureococcus anophagefferens]|nr:GTPase [Aureococcus anophagefferens]
MIADLVGHAPRIKKSSRPYDLQIKLLMIGDSAVGKTSLLLRYANDTFSSTFITTIGIDFKIKTVDLDGKRVKLQIWDTAGQEQFRTITRSYFRGAQGIVLVYDITDRGTFNSVRSWMAQIADHADAQARTRRPTPRRRPPATRPQVNRILVANKCDYESARQVSADEGRRLAEEYNVRFLETSAKNDVNVAETFTTIAREVTARIPTEGGKQAGGQKLKSGGSGGKSGCCK